MIAVHGCDRSGDRVHGCDRFHLQNRPTCDQGTLTAGGARSPLAVMQKFPNRHPHLSAMMLREVYPPSASGVIGLLAPDGRRHTESPSPEETTAVPHGTAL